jgi:hypothetical protein
MLKTLANWDKHRSLHLMVAHPERIHYTAWMLADLAALAPSPPPGGPFKSGDIVARFHILEEFRQKQKPITATIKAALLFDEDVPSPTSERWWVVMLLQRMLNYVDERALPSFAKYL